jgi:triacylglycerol lipase
VWEPWPFLRPLAELLFAHGVAVHTLPELGYNSGPVAEGARTLGRIVVERDLRDVVLVAHSKGGLIGKLAMLQHDPESRIAAMIAVNSPFSGSAYARWLPLRSLRAFVPSDAMLVALTAEVEVNSRITSVHAFWDPHIPAGSALDGAEEIVLPTPGHFRPLADPRLHALLLERLTR